MNQILAALLIAAAGAFGGWTAQGWHLGEKIEALKADHSAAITDAVRETSRALAAMTSDRDAKADLLAAIDLKFTTQLTKARHESKVLAARLAAGTAGLRIAATCPAVDSKGTGEAQGGSLDSGAAAVLTPAAERSYLALRENIIATENKLTACQESLAVFIQPPQESP